MMNKDAVTAPFGWREAGLLAMLLLVSLATRLPGIGAPPVAYQGWRETDTLMIARNYARHDLHLFRPEVDRRSSMKMTTRGYIGGTELPVTPWLTAFVYRVAGETFWAGRVVPLAFALLGTALFFLLARRFLGTWPACAAALLLLLSPFHLYLGRVQMPESFAYAMAYGALFFLDRWCCLGRWRDYVAGIVFAALMLLGKPQLGVMAVPMAFLVLRRFGRHTFVNPRVYAFATLAGLPALLWVGYSFFIVLPRTGLSFAQPGLLSHAQMLTDSDYYLKMARSVFWQALTPGLALLAVAGLLFPGRGRTWLGHAWLAGGLALFFALPGACDINSYYHMILAPPAALLAARLLALLGSNGAALRVVSAAVLLVTCAGSAWIGSALWTPRYLPDYHCGTWVREHTPPEARVMTSSASPVALYFADRIGWTSWARTYGVGASFKLNYLNEVRTLGATHLAIPDPNFDNAWLFQQYGLHDVLYDNFRCYKARDFTVFFLQEPADPRLPQGQLDFGTLAARPYLRGTWGPDQEDDNGTFVAMGPSTKSALRALFPGPVTLRLASAVPKQTLTLRCGEHLRTVHLSESGEPREITLPLEPSPAPRIIFFEVTRRNDTGASLLLYRLTAIPVPGGPAADPQEGTPGTPIPGGQ